jgi:hypothetical protein
LKLTYSSATNVCQDAAQKIWQLIADETLQKELVEKGKKAERV